MSRWKVPYTYEIDRKYPDSYRENTSPREFINTRKTAWIEYKDHTSKLHAIGEVTVDAASPEEARQKAEKKVNNEAELRRNEPTHNVRVTVTVEEPRPA